MTVAAAASRRLARGPRRGARRLRHPDALDLARAGHEHPAAAAPLPGTPARLAPHAGLDAGLAMIGLHVGAVLADPVMRFGLPAVLVPFAAPWRPAAVAAGVVAGWLTLMLAVSFRMRRLIGQRGWRRLHYASFAAFVLALGHALAAGTDLAGIGGPVLAVVAGGPVLWLTLVRILTPRAPAAPATAAAPAPPDPTQPSTTTDEGDHHELPHHHRPRRLLRVRRLRRRRPAHLRDRGRRHRHAPAADR